MRMTIAATFLSLTAAVSLITAPAGPAHADDPLAVSVLVPITGFLALEGTAQRNGAILALDGPPEGVAVTYDVADTATSPEVAVTALRRALDRQNPVAIAAPIFGTQMLAMAPIADRAGVPLITVSGTAKLTELGHDVVFRFFPTDAVVKVAQARYAVRELGMKRPAILYQTTAYGQSGRTELVRVLGELGVAPVLEEALDPSVKDFVPALERVADAGADGLLLQLHSGPTALAVRQAHELGFDGRIVAGSALHQPTTAALVEPAALAGVCAESASSPVSESGPAMAAFAAAYRDRFEVEPDAFALAQYDGMRMVLAALADGARTAEAVKDWLATNRYQGLAMEYVSDGTGNMAHDAIILCYDGETRTPTVVKRYDNVDGVR